MDYEQKYKEALERAKGAHNSAKSDKENGIIDKITEYTIQLTETIFPELKESEDEQIKKRIIQSLHGDVLDMEETNKAITWLEKQGNIKDIHLLELKAKAYDDARERMSYAYNQNRVPIGFISEIFPNLNSYENQDNKPQGKSALEAINEEKVEPKFKIGDWVVFNGLTLYINEVVKGYYRTIPKGGIPNSYDWDINNAARLWTIEDAKDGDVLVASDDSVFIFARVDGCACIYHIALANDGVLTINPQLIFAWENVRGVKPATKEQHDKLEKAMLKDGYKWDANKKELIKL